MKKLDKFKKIIPILFENDLTKSWAIKHLNVIKNCNKETYNATENCNSKNFQANTRCSEAGPRGFEPPTPGLEGLCSIHTELRAHFRASIQTFKIFC